MTFESTIYLQYNPNKAVFQHTWYLLRRVLFTPPHMLVEVQSFNTLVSFAMGNKILFTPPRMLDGVLEWNDTQRHAFIWPKIYMLHTIRTT